MISKALTPLLGELLVIFGTKLVFLGVVITEINFVTGTCVFHM